MSQPSVLIAGAGPAGLILAIILLKNNVPVRLINAESKHRIGSRGAGIQPRTLELYDILGVLPEFLKLANTDMGRRRMYELPGGSKVVKELPVVDYVEPTPGTPHTNPVSISQELHEGVLREYLSELGGTVELSTALRSFEQFPDHVVAQIVKTGADGTERTEVAKFDWLVGTDGVHSVVRKQLGLSFLGETKEEEHVLVGDIDVDEGLEHGFWHYWIPPSQMIVLRPGTGNSWRMAFTGGPEHWKQTVPTRDEFVEEFCTVTGRHDIKFGAATWMSGFKPSMRMVDKFGLGRVFVAGDAAHCHSPTGGQGLNSSVQDAANLGWKLALVASGRAPAALLDSYSAERLPVIAEMLKLTTALYEKTAGAAAGVAGDANAWAQASARGGALGMLGVNTQGSTIMAPAPGGAYGAVEAAPGRVQAGYRAPDAPGLVGAEGTVTRLFDVFGPAAHTLLILGGDAAMYEGVKRALGHWPKGTERTLLVRRAGEKGESAIVGLKVLGDREGHAYAGYASGMAEGEASIVIVRPDGMIGAVVSDAEGIERYRKLIFG
ncbi:FAD binding domain-containing protein [Mycena leptocephala]|nr:FAD binding domain-containing protein [Mycena leptocephala]